MKYAITGVSMLTSIGNTTDECFDALCRGVDGNSPLKSFNQDKFHAKKAYEIDDRDQNKDVTLRATRWLNKVITDALQSARFKPGNKKIAVFVGTGLRELRSLELWWADKHSFQVNELHFGNAVCKEIGMSVPVTTLSNACSAANFALGLAYDSLALGEIDAAIVAGCDSITESMFALLDRVNPLHPQELRALDINRKGVIMGEGAAAVILEALPDNPALIKAWLRGVGMSCDAYQDTKPFKDGIVKAIRDSFHRADVQPGEVDLLFIHGTGTILNDQVELEAVQEVYGEHIKKVKVTGLKSNIGHTSGAAALVNVVAAVQCMQQHKIPPIFGLCEPIPEARDMNLVLNRCQTAVPDIVQVNAFGFGGVNAVSILERNK